MSLNVILFMILAIIAIASALGMLFSKNAVYSALFLIINFSVVAVFYLLLDAPFIALTQITIYAGAIMVLFLFVIMLMGAEQTGIVTAARWVKPVAFVLAAILVVETAYIMFIEKGAIDIVSSVAVDFGGPAAVGKLLFNQYLLPFEVTSVLLLTAMIGAIVLSQRKR